MDPQILKSFECHTPLFSRERYESNFINVSDYKRIKFMFFSDCNLLIRLVCSFDGATNCALTLINYDCKKQWKDYVYPIGMDYLKISIEKVVKDSLNDEIHVVCKGQLNRSVLPKPLLKEESKEEQKSEITPSPKRSFVSKVLSSPTKNLNSSSIEMPNLCLPNQLFICGKNKINLLPPPDKQGQVLTFDGNEIKWM